MLRSEEHEIGISLGDEHLSARIVGTDGLRGFGIELVGMVLAAGDNIDTAQQGRGYYALMGEGVFRGNNGFMRCQLRR